MLPEAGKQVLFRLQSCPPYSDSLRLAGLF